jgi:hypothetical protein
MNYFHSRLNYKEISKRDETETLNHRAPAHIFLQSISFPRNHEELLYHQVTL